MNAIALPERGLRSGVDAQNPWPGLAAFTEELQEFFHGRSEEADELLRRVERKDLTVLFGQSGLGKSSLLQAGLFPRLRAEGYLPVPIRLDHAAAAPALSEQVKAAVSRAILDAGGRAENTATVAGDTLWEHFHRRGLCLHTPEGEPVRLVLVLDQFEELFAIGHASEATRARAAHFLTELADLIENRTPKALDDRLEESPELVRQFALDDRGYRALICLREDYLPHLESLRASMPSIAENRMRLTRMNGLRALEAVLDPGGDLITPEVGRQVVRFVAGGRMREAGLANGEGEDDELVRLEVEPSLLSLVCRELNNRRLALGLSQITADLLAGSRERILQDYYERCVADQPPAVRLFVEDELVTDSGLRENIALERAHKALTLRGGPVSAIDELVKRRLLHLEERLDIQRVELTHDVLTAVVKKSRDQRQQQEAMLRAEQQARKVREKARRQRRRFRLIVAGMAGALAVLSGFAALSYYQLKEAQTQKDRAENGEQSASQARADALKEKTKAEGERDRAEKEKERAEKGEQAARRAGLEALREKEHAEKERDKADHATRERTQAYAKLEAASYMPRIGQAQREWQNGNNARAEELLDESPPHLRGWEWGYLKSLSQSHLFALHGHGKTIYNVVYSADGKLLATASDDGRVEIWDAVTHQLVRTLFGHKSSVVGLAFSSDSQLIASASDDKTVKIWQVGSGKLMRNLPGHHQLVHALAFSPNGKKLASICMDKTAKLWDVATGKLLLNMDVGTTVLFGGIAFLPHKGQVQIAASRPDDRGEVLATGNQAGEIQLWDTSTGKALRRLKAHSGAVSGIAFTPDGQFLISGGYDKLVKLWDTTEWSLVRTMTGHSGTITHVAVSPDGKIIASASNDRTAKIWDVKTGQDLQTLNGHGGTVTGVAFSADSRRLACSSFNKEKVGEVKVWNARVSQDARVLLSDGGSGVTFSPDGKRLASGGWRIRILDTRTGLELYSFRPAPTSWSEAVAFSATGKLLASGSADGRVRIWDPSLEKPLIRTCSGHSERVASVAFHPDGRLLASAGGDSTVRIWDLMTGQEVATLKGHTGSVEGVAFSPNGRWLASAGSDWTVRIWDTGTWRPSLTYRGHTHQVYCVTFVSHDLIASGGGDASAGEVRIWNLQTTALLGRAQSTMGLFASTQGALFGVPALILGSAQADPQMPALGMKDALVLRGHGSSVFSVTVSKDRFATSSYDRTVRIWDKATGQELVALPAGKAPVAALAFSPDGKELVLANDADGVRVWDAPTQELFALRGHTNEVRCLAYSPDGKMLASAGNAEVKLWDARTGRQLARPPMEQAASILGVAISPDGRYVASGGGVLDAARNVWISGQVRIWDAATGADVQRFRGHADTIRWVAYSPNGRYLATASNDRTVKIWDVATGKEIQTLKGHEKYVNTVAYSPDGSRLASASSDQTVKVWNAATGKLIETLRGHNGDVTDVTFSRDGRWLASAGTDGNVIVWSARTLKQQRLLRGHIGIIECISFHPDSRQLASAGHDGLVIAWDVLTGRQALVHRGHIGIVNSVVYSPDGQYLATGGEDTTVKVWAARQNPDEVFAWQWRISEDFRSAKLWPQAMMHLDQVIELEPKNASLLNMRGNYFFERGLMTEAIPDYSRAIALSPGYAIYYRNRANARVQKKELDAASDDFTRAIVIDPRDDVAYEWRGWIHSQKGEWKAAIADFAKDIEIDPKYAHGYLQRGICRYRINEFDASIGDFTKAISIDPRQELAHYWRAEAHFQRAELQLAMADYTKAVDMDPKHVEAYGGRGRVRRVARDFPGAIADFTRAFEISKNPIWLYWRGRARYQNNDMTGALADLDKAIERDSKLDLAYLFRGLVLLRNGKEADAKADFDRTLQFRLDLNSLEEGIKLDPENGPGYLLRGILLLRRGKDAQAKADVDRALKLEPALKVLLAEEQRKGSTQRKQRGHP